MKLELKYRVRELILCIVMILLLTGLCSLHIAVSRELDYANAVIKFQHNELLLQKTPFEFPIILSRESDIQSPIILSRPSSPTDISISLIPPPTLKSLIESRIQSLQPRLDSILRTEIANAILKYSSKYKLSPSLILHLICRETIPRFNPLSKSSKDAIGLMQVRYEVHIKDIPELANIKTEELYHIDNNIKFGCQILRKYIDATEFLDKALKKYVGGEVKGYVEDIYRMMAEWEQEKK